PNTARTLCPTHKKGERVWPGRLLFRGHLGLRLLPEALSLCRLSLMANGNHELGTPGAQLEEPLVAQVGRLVDEDLGQLGAFWNVERDGWGDVFFLLGLHLLAELPLNVPGRAVEEVIPAVLDLHVLHAVRPHIRDLPSEVTDLFLVVATLDPEL